MTTHRLPVMKNVARNPRIEPVKRKAMPTMTIFFSETKSPRDP